MDGPEKRRKIKKEKLSSADTSKVSFRNYHCIQVTVKCEIYIISTLMWIHTCYLILLHKTWDMLFLISILKKCLTLSFKIYPQMNNGKQSNKTHETRRKRRVGKDHVGAGESTPGRESH